MPDIVILSATRTPIGAFQGAFAGVPAPKLGAAAIKSAVARAGVAPADVTDCLMGNVLQAGLGQAPARQAAIGAGLPQSTRCITVHKVCGSGLQTVIGASHFLAGGMGGPSLAYVRPGGLGRGGSRANGGVGADRAELFRLSRSVARGWGSGD